MVVLTGGPNKVKASSSGEMDDRSLSYNAFFLIIVAYTAFEILIFLNRDNWSLVSRIFVPLLLALTLLKFILVVGWFLYNGRETNWVRKAMLVFLVTAGASGLITHLLI